MWTENRYGLNLGFMFERKDGDNMYFDFDKMSEEFGIKLPKVKLVDSPGKEELFINDKSVCCHKRLYPADVLETLAKHEIINFTHEK